MHFGYIISVLAMVSCNSTSVNASRAKNDVIKSWLYTVTCNLNQISLLASVSFTTLLAPKYGHQASQLSTVSRQSTKEFMRKSNAEKLNRMEVQSDKTKITFILLLILKICVCHPPPLKFENGKKSPTLYIFQLAVPLQGKQSSCRGFW